MDFLTTTRDLYRSFLDSEFLKYKFENYRKFTFFVACCSVLFIMSMWFWDLAIDPVNAKHTLWMRLAMALGAASVLPALSPNRAKWIYVMLVPMLIIYLEYINIWAMHQTHHGAYYGLGGFLYFFLFIPFLAMPYSVRFGILCLTVVPLFPIVAVHTGLTPPLNMPVYHVYVWTAYISVLLILLTLERQNRKLFDYRKQIEKLATEDGLTEIPNRRHLLQMCENLISLAGRYEKKISFLMMDIDHFKWINDTYGHTAGDQAIKAIADRAVGVTRRSDIVGRYGGEEFLIALPEAGREQALLVAERIRTSIQQTHIRLGGKHDVRITVSLGAFTLTPDRPERYDLQTCINEADLALYEAKQTGRNKTVTRFTKVNPAMMDPGTANQLRGGV